MASVTKSKAGVWLAYFRNAAGKAFCRSTGLRAVPANKSAAMRFAAALESGVRSGEAGVMLRVVGELAAEISGGGRRVMLADFLAEWREEKRLEVSPATAAWYASACRRFEAWAGAVPLASITREKMLAYRAHLAGEVAPRSVNHAIKALRMAFRAAMRRGLIAINPADVSAVKTAASARGVFGLESLRSLLAIASPEWRGLILFGFYTGQRLGDIARATRAQITGGEWAFLAGKTSRESAIPLHAALVEWLRSAPSTGPLFPAAAASIVSNGGRVTALSKQFASLLSAAGIDRGSDARSAALAAFYGVNPVTVQRWQAAGESAGVPCPVESPAEMPEWWRCVCKKAVPASIRSAAARPLPPLSDSLPGRQRQRSRLSFHCLRHTATSLLKSGGASAAVAMDLIGHKSAAVSALYTHTGATERRAAVDSLPTL